MSLNRRNYLAAAGGALAATVLSTTARAEPAPGQPSGPDVRVINKPNEPVPVALQGTAQIDTSTPLPVRDVDRREKEPVQFTLFIPGPDSFTVPAGRNLVVEFVSGSFAIRTTGGALATVTLSTGAGSFAHVFAGTPISYNDGEAGGNGFAFSQSCRIFAESGGTVRLQASQGVLLASLSVSGFLVDAD